MADSKRITEEFYQAKIRPRITKKDRQILKFIYRQRLVTSEQINRVFYSSNKGNRACNMRLNILENELYCINRLYPKTNPGEGKDFAHISLDRAGLKELGINSKYIIKKLPISYKHYIKVNDFSIYAHSKGWGWGKTEYKFKNCITDIYYPLTRIAVEIDTGTESHKLFIKQAEKYNYLNNINGIIFVSNSRDRSNKFISKIKYIKKVAGTTFDEFEKVVDQITPKL